jgi:hypothetical protein
MTYLIFNEATKNANDKNLHMGAAKNELLSITHHQVLPLCQLKTCHNRKLATWSYTIKSDNLSKVRFTPKKYLQAKR